MSKQLLPRVFAADRMSDMQNSLLSANQLLIESNKDFENRNMLDIETGVGNQRYAHDALSKMIKHTEARGGASSYMLITIKDWAKIKQQNNHMIREELALGITRRLRSLIRPLDSLCRISEDQYAVIAHFSHIDYCTTGSYRRIHDGINLKSFKTLSGYISMNAASSVCTIDDQTQTPSIADIELHCQDQVQQAINTGTIVISRWKKQASANYS